LQLPGIQKPFESKLIGKVKFANDCEWLFFDDEAVELGGRKKIGYI
jgi:hypothetical protein